MKKLFIIGVFAFAGLANAQVNLGVKAGYALSSIDSSSSFASYHSKSTYYGGLLSEVKFGRIAVQGEVLYTELGATENVSLLPGYLTTDISLHSILVPIMAKYYIADNFSVGVGANFGFVVSAQAKVSSTNAIVSSQLNGLGINGNRDIGNLISTMQFSPFISAEYNLPLGFFVDARYNFGVTNLNDNKQLLGNTSIKNSFWQVGVGYKF